MIVVADSGPLPYLILLENLTLFRAPLRETRGPKGPDKTSTDTAARRCSNTSATWTDASSSSNGWLSATTVLTESQASDDSR